MDKETAVELERLKTKVAVLEKAYDICRKLIIDAVIHTLKWMGIIIASGLATGLAFPSSIRKQLLDWWIGK